MILRNLSLLAILRICRPVLELAQRILNQLSLNLRGQATLLRHQHLNRHSLVHLPRQVKDQVVTIPQNRFHRVILRTFQAALELRDLPLATLVRLQHQDNAQLVTTLQNQFLRAILRIYRLALHDQALNQVTLVHLRHLNRPSLVHLQHQGLAPLVTTLQNRSRQAILRAFPLALELPGLHHNQLSLDRLQHLNNRSLVPHQHRRVVPLATTPQNQLRRATPRISRLASERLHQHLVIPRTDQRLSVTTLPFQLPVATILVYRLARVKPEALPAPPSQLP